MEKNYFFIINLVPFAYFILMTFEFASVIEKIKSYDLY